jgi:hypothetical protein
VVVHRRQRRARQKSASLCEKQARPRPGSRIRLEETLVRSISAGAAPSRGLRQQLPQGEFVLLRSATVRIYVQIEAEDGSLLADQFRQFLQVLFTHH